MVRKRNAFVQSKRAMGTVFGGLFFIIIMMMAFNLMLWGFGQYDVYQSRIVQAALSDQARYGEKIEVHPPGARDFAPPTFTSFNISLNNRGGVEVQVARIYIVKLSCEYSVACQKYVGQTTAESSLNCSTCYLANYNVPVGIFDHRIKIFFNEDIRAVDDIPKHRFSIVTTRGNVFSFSFPMPSPPPPRDVRFTSDIGPLRFFFDFNSFNYTKGTQSTPQPAWCMTQSVDTVIWIKITNTATDSEVRLRVQSVLLFLDYSGSGTGNEGFYIVDKDSVHPGFDAHGHGVQSYNPAVDPYILPPANPDGSSTSVIVKFSATTEGGSSPNKLPMAFSSMIVFIGLFYNYNGQDMGTTVPFVATTQSGSC